MAEKVNISITNLNKAVESERNLNALTLSVIIKMNYTNSVMYDFSIRKLMRTCHCNYAKAKEILEDGLSSGLVYIDGNHLRARKISRGGRKNAMLHIVHKEGGPQIFLKRDNSDLIRRLHYSSDIEDEWEKERKLEQMTEYLCDADRYLQFRSDGKKQTFRDIHDVILKLSILHQLRNWRKMFVTFNRKYGKKEHSRVNEKGMESIDYLNAGISYQAIADRHDGIKLSRYQISRLVKSLIESGLITSKKSITKFLDFDYEIEHEQLTHEDFIVPNPRLMKHVYMGGHVYLGKGKNYSKFYRRMGNIYGVHDDVWRYKKGYRPKTKSNEMHG